MKAPRRKKILSLMQCTNLGGMEQSAYFLMEELGQRDFEFSVATPQQFGPGRDRIAEIDGDAKDCSYRGKFGWRSHSEFMKIVEDKSSGCSGVIVTGTDVACMRAARSLDLPIVLGNHYHHFESRFSFLKWRGFYELFARKVARVVFPTQFTYREAIGIAPWLKRVSEVVPYHFPISEVGEEERVAAKESLGFEADDFVVGNAGWFISRKRWDLFFDVAEKLASDRSNARFLACGGGPLEDDFKLRCERKGLAEKTVFAGWQKDMRSHYLAMDALLFNSDFDALGRTPGEAMGFGVVPVASVAYGGLAELIDHNENGFLLSRHDTDQLTEFLKTLEEDRDLLRTMQEAGRLKLESEYSREAAVGFYRSFFA